MTLRAVLGAAVSLLTLWTPPAYGGGVPPARFEDPGRRVKLAAAFPEIEKIFAEAVEKQHIPGAAIGVVIDGELVFTKGFGVRDVASKAPADADTVFRIASMTKSFTAIAILKLRDEGKLSLDDAVSRYVPELRGLAKATGDAPALTIRHLLSHSGGFPEDNPWGDRQLSVSDETFARWLKAGIPFSNTPGVAFEYSNTGFAILGRVVARVSGMRYRDYVDKNVLRPLGMTSTKWEAASVPADRLAKGYRRESEASIEEPTLADGAYGASASLARAADGLATPLAWGRCTRGEVLSSDGETTSVVRFNCERGRLDADIAFDKKSSRLTSVRLVPADGETCVP